MPQTILSLSAEYIRLPLKNPFVIAIRTATNANVVRWTLTTQDARDNRLAQQQFLGECVPVQYVTGESPETVLAIAPKIEALLMGQDVAELPHLVSEMHRSFPSDIAARAGVEIALYAAYCDLIQIPLESILGGENAKLRTDLTIGRIPNATDVAIAAWDEGFREFKMKVGGCPHEEDVQRIMAIAARRPTAVFRLDGNQSFSVTSILELVDDLLQRGANIELIEQPVPKEDFTALAELAEKSVVPVIADEACKSAKDAYELFSQTAVHGVNVKLMKSGIAGSLDIIRIAKAAGRKLMIGCMLESEIGMAASVALACGTNAFDYIDLDGHLLLDLEKPTELFVAEGPFIRMP